MLHVFEMAGICFNFTFRDLAVAIRVT